MSRWCRGCESFRRRISPPLGTCKPFRLCLAVDVSLLDRYPGRDLEEYREMAREIELGYLRSARLARGPFPATGKDLLEAAVAVHLAIFKNGDPEIAGRIRIGDVYFGSGINQMKGIQPTEIERSFQVMDTRLPLSGDRLQMATWGARMLHRFLAIHPFDDGNGRVARRLLEWGIEIGDRWTFAGHHRTSRRESRQYVQALQYADRHAPHSTNLKATPQVNHLQYLTRWLEKRIVERIDPEEALEPPAARQPHV
jgi:fido (protein-threonine AMPylation protein)